MRVLDVQADERGMRLTVETERQVEGCGDCGVLAVLHGRREHLLHDVPFAASPGAGALAQAGLAVPGVGVPER